MRIEGWLAAVGVATLPVQAFACMVPTWDGQARLSDAVVQGSLSITGTREGVIVPTRIEKGEARNRYSVTWEAYSGEGSGPACPAYQPLRPQERGTFYLRRLSDGNFLVVARKP